MCPCRTLIIQITECEIAEQTNRIQKKRLSEKKEKKTMKGIIRKYNKCTTPPSQTPRTIVRGCSN
jgi:hypothetical protein